MRVLGLMAAALVLTGASRAPAHHVGEVAASGGPIAYETFGVKGEALPVIVINGGPGLSHAYLMMNDLWPKVGRRRLVVVYDQRGTGASKPLRGGASQDMDAQVADLEAVRAALGLEKVALVGDSYGGMIAMAYAAAHADHVAKLVLSDSAAPSWKAIDHLLPDAFPDIEAEDAAEQKALGGTTDDAARASLRNHFRMIFYAPEKRDAYMAKMGDLGFEPKVSGDVAEALKDLDLTPKLTTITCPVLVLTGRYDLNVAPLTAWRMAHAFPNAAFKVFEKSGHLPAYEEPARYEATLEAFLGPAHAPDAGRGR